MKKQVLILQIYPSKKVNGDLIAYMPTTKGHNMVIIIDKNCEQFPFASAGQLWQMEVSTKESENFGLATLLTPVEIECCDCYKETPAFQVKVKGVQDPIMEICFPTDGEYNAFVKGMIIMYARKAGLGAFEKQIVAEFRELYDVFKSKNEAASEVIADAVTLIKQNTEVPSNASIENIEDLSVLNMLWKNVKIETLPSAEELAAKIVEQGIYYRKGKFLQVSPEKTEKVTV